MASVEPVVATFVGILFFQEMLTPLSALGVALVLAAVVLLNLNAPIKQKKEKTMFKTILLDFDGTVFATGRASQNVCSMPCKNAASRPSYQTCTAFVDHHL